MNDFEKNAIEFLKKHETYMAFRHKCYMSGYFGKNDTLKRDIYYVTIFRKGFKEWQFTFAQSAANSSPSLSKMKKPTKYDVLACLTKHNPGSFREFCDNYGYNSDPISDHKTYLAVCREWEHVSEIFHDCLDELREIS